MFSQERIQDLKESWISHIDIYFMHHIQLITTHVQIKFYAVLKLSQFFKKYVNLWTLHVRSLFYNKKSISCRKKGSFTAWSLHAECSEVFEHSSTLELVKSSDSLGRHKIKCLYKQLWAECRSVFFLTNGSFEKKKCSFGFHKLTPFIPLLIRKLFYYHAAAYTTRCS